MRNTLGERNEPHPSVSRAELKKIAQFDIQFEISFQVTKSR